VGRNGGGASGRASGTSLRNSIGGPQERDRPATPLRAGPSRPFGRPLMMRAAGPSRRYGGADCNKRRRTSVGSDQIRSDPIRSDPIRSDRVAPMMRDTRRRSAATLISEQAHTSRPAGEVCARHCVRPARGIQSIVKVRPARWRPLAERRPFESSRAATPAGRTRALDGS
jgi:hypothetical protein